MFQPEEPRRSKFSSSAIVPGVKTVPGVRVVFSKGPRTIGAAFATSLIGRTDLMCRASITQ